MSISRWLYFIWTFVIAGPLALMGLSTLIGGNYVDGALFLGLAIATFAIFEYVYIRLVGS